MTAATIIKTPFGLISFDIKSGDWQTELVNRSEAIPKLLNGQRVDACKTITLRLLPRDSETAIFSLDCELNPDFETGPASGQFLDAWKMDGHKCTGVYGMRDKEWWEYHNIDAVEVTEHKTTIQLQKSNSQLPKFEFSAAWVTNPTNEQEELSPWFAVDYALN